MKALRKGADLEKINDIHNAAAAYQRQPAGIRRMTFGACFLMQGLVLSSAMG